MSKVTVETVEEGRIKVIIPVSEKLFEKGMDIAFNKVKNDVKIDGFRKGKITRVMFEQKFGKESLYTEALDAVVPDAYTQAIEEAKLVPVAMPKIDIVSFEVPENIVISAEVVVKPEVKLGAYSDLGIKKAQSRVTEKEIEAEITNLAKQNAELVLKEGGTVEDGDTTIMDFEGFLDGVAFDGGKGENHTLEIGSNQFIPGFEEAMIGMKEGETKDLDITFPESYHAPDLAGKSVVFKVTVHEIKTREFPEVNDAFVKELGREGIETVDALKKSIKEEIKTKKNESTIADYRKSIIEKATENAEMVVHPEMVDEQVERMVRDFEQRISQQGMNLPDYLQYTGSSVEKMREEMQPTALENIKQTMTLEAIADAENIEVLEKDVDAKLQEMADMYQMKLEDIKKHFAGNVDGLKYEIKLDKTVEFLTK